jgi:hypothetical protein
VPKEEYYDPCGCDADVRLAYPTRVAYNFRDQGYYETEVIFIRCTKCRTRWDAVKSEYINEDGTNMSEDEIRRRRRRMSPHMFPEGADDEG